ncbi:2,5-diketo-D-gluconic acid reductase [Alphaproteobacteria bacterium]|nr:2,5-diketo-D-gluconic acid reductase [Alphaproteobacteria bacterium]
MTVKFSDRAFCLANGISIPAVGFGTWRVPDGDIAVKSVLAALNGGYTHIDTAAIYGNEKSVGVAIKESGISRKDLFITTKLWDTEHSYDKALLAFDQSLADLGIDYVDLYLIHWPTIREESPDFSQINLDTWRALELLYEHGRAKAIGVSNFLGDYLSNLLEKAKVVPAINQIEYHIGQIHQKTVDICQKNNILIEAWGPLGGGDIVDHPALKGLVEKYNVSVAQLCVRWCLQNNTLPLVKSVNPERIKKNLDVFDFAITDEDMNFLNEMGYIGGSGLYFEKFQMEEYQRYSH